ncbi:MAG: hypothetical protein Q4D85_12080 [Corynebacterium sp.]|uniref:hypothetical protein n=1 Tax=Corynebacterium sp. TaxID=1720 RepID=UPI0026DBE9CD|nr:hypothetical protein [Corynebacterium sp.]MDO5099474.1 hypothetical protein [Corynebacterium sp.]
MSISNHYQFFPELSHTEVDLLLEKVDFQKEQLQLHCDIEAFIKEIDYSNLEDGDLFWEQINNFFEKEPIPFFEATWKIANLSFRSLKDAIDSAGFE